MAKELDIRNDEILFASDSREFISDGQRAAQAALESVGGYLGLVEKLPFDRGDTNHGLVQLCLKMAAVVERTRPQLAASLRAEAVRLGDATKAAGTPRDALPIEKLLSELRNIWKELDEQHKAEITDKGGLAGDLVELFDIVRILFVSCNPATSGEQLKLQAEQRAIKDTLKRSPNSLRFQLETYLPRRLMIYEGLYYLANSTSSISQAMQTHRAWSLRMKETNRLRFQ